ncbi:alpha/beta fold hydrolase [Sulfitobacter sp. HNIBRBA2951]|uniref:alpha/beta fold hydrolase n=1 Tax=Sulfitobacter aquimarinus TaxID=3158557 RepID=UPI0032DE92F7
MPTLEHSGIQQHYEVTGGGPPLILVAGMMSDSASWAPLLPLLEPHFTVIRPDNRTTGRTVPWDAPASVPLFAQDLAALVDHLGLGPCHVMGHSLGGMIAMHLASARPDCVKTLTLAASAPLRLARNIALFDSILAIRRSDAPPDAWLRALFLWLFSPTLYDTPDAIEMAAAASLAYPFAQTTEAMAHQIAALDSYTPDDIATLRCPVQALLADGDMLLPTALALPTLGDTPVHHIAGAGHSIHWDAPEAVARHLVDFITKHEEPPR